MPDTRKSEIEQLRATVAELQNTLRSNANNIELEQLKATVAELQANTYSNGQQTDKFRLPDPIKEMSEFSGNKKELAAWLEELDELYDMYRIKGDNGAPDTFCSHYLRAIKNKIKHDARTVLCANGNPNTIPGIKKVLLEHFGDQRDLPTNLSHLFHMKRGDRNHHKFYSDVKELCMKLKTNLSMNPINSSEILEILIITKYLDNIGEPLASIIRQSKPKSLEEAYQAVCVNQNAETRNRPTKPLFKNIDKTDRTKHNNSNSNPKPPFTTNSKPPFKNPPFQRKARPEANNNEVEELPEEEEEELGYDNDDDEDASEIETNFQTVCVAHQPT